MGEWLNERVTEKVSEQVSQWLIKPDIPLISLFKQSFNHSFLSVFYHQVQKF